MEEVNLADILYLANEKLCEITGSKRDLGIYKHLMLRRLLRQWSTERDGDKDGERKSSSRESGNLNPREDTNFTRHRSNAKRKSPKRKPCKDSARPPMRCKRHCKSGDYQPPSPLVGSAYTMGSNPLHVTPTKYGPTHHQENHRAADTDKSSELDWLLTQMSVSPLLDAI